MGRWLDRRAATPGPVGWIIRFFSSVKLGVLWLFLTALYMGLGSGLPSLRAYFDLSTMQFFDAPPMIILMVLLCVTLAVVTLRRIRLTLYKLGVWTVHTGIITLILSLFLYFGGKHEGMILLREHQTVRHYYDNSQRALYIRAEPTAGRGRKHPRISQRGLRASAKPNPQITRISRILRTKRTRPRAPSQEHLRAARGNTGRVARIGPKSGARVTNQIPHAAKALPVRSADLAAEARGTGLNRVVMAPLPQLPLFKLRAPRNGDPLRIKIPAVELAGLGRNFSGLQIRVIGYYPYSELAAFPVARRPGIPPRQPAVEINLNAAGAQGGRWLLAKSPAGRVLDNDSPFGIEYLYHPSPRRWRDITTAFHGRDALIVSVPADHVRRVYIIHPHQRITVAGTPYTLTPRRWINMPLIAPAYRGATSQGYIIDVVRRKNGRSFHFQRVALFRYPSQSVDFIFPHGHRSPQVTRSGGRLAPGLVDHHLRIVYEDARHDQLWVVEHRSGRLSLVHRAAGGAVRVQPVRGGQTVPVTIDGMHIGFTVERIARVVWRPYVIPPNRRRPHIEQTMGHCLLRLALADGRWRSRPIYLPYRQFGFGRQRRGVTVKIPRKGRLTLAFSQRRRRLPVAVTLLQAKELFYPGGHNFPRDFISQVRIRNLKTGRTRTRLIHLNHPAKVAGLSFFQARFGRESNGAAFSVLGVGNTRGFYGMLAGVVMIFLGIGYAFYVKPVLLNMKKRQLAAYARAAEARTEESTARLKSCGPNGKIR